MDAVLGFVDDDESTLYTVKAMADSLGWSILTTSQPQEALDWVINRRIDILLVDYHMPLMGGIDVIRSARQLSSEAILIALTVEENPSVAANLKIAGADDFISKPIRLADFSARILLHSELLKYRSDEHWQERSKGLSEKTTRRVQQLFSSKNIKLTVGDAAEAASLSYPAMHRYLEYLVKKGQLQRVTEYENVRSGRPRNIYFKPSK